MQNKLEVRGLMMALLVTLLISIGGLVEIVPLFLVNTTAPPLAGVKPYRPLELEGRDIYIREGCYLCHSQMVRPFRDETERYGEYSKPGEFVYDHPFQWGSKRTGPDLHREGGKRDNLWHYRHMMDPREMSPGSIMPRYRWLATNTVDTALTPYKMQALRKVGVPYTDLDVSYCTVDIQAQTEQIVASLKAAKLEEATPDREIIALIAYLQRLGTDIKVSQPAAAATR